MPTELQQKAVDKIVEQHGTVSISRVMREVGYKPKTAKNPKNLTESKGYEQILNRYGLTKGLVVRALVSDIKAKPKNRVKELNLGAEILHLKDNDETVRPNINILVIPSEIAERHGVKVNDSNSITSVNR